MHTPKLFVSLVIAAALAGCTGGHSSSVTRSAAGMETQNVLKTSAEARLEAQATSLDAMTRDLVRASTIRGAGMGALAGCATALISASSAGQCAGGALVGGAIGAAVGKSRGQKKVAEQMALVSRNDVAQSLSRASARLGSVRAGLHDVIEAQDKERVVLKARLSRGEMTEAQYKARLAAMADTRRVVAEALTVTADHARSARSNLNTAQSSGQSDLEWHVDAAETLEDDAISARTAITLL